MRRAPHAIAIAALATFPAITQSATKYWIASHTTGSWTDNTRWSTTNNAGPNNTTSPADGDSANFVFNDATPRTLTANPTLTGTGLLSLTASNLGSGNLTLTLPATASLLTNTLSLGGGSNVTFSSHGSLTPATLSIGTTSSAGSPTFSQSGGALSASAINVGLLSPGLFAHNTAAVTTTSLTVGAGSSGTYAMTSNPAAALTITGSATLGATAGSTGAFVHSTGTHSLAGHLTLGAAAGATGSYTLSSTATLLSADVSVGSGGAGTFLQTGGTHTVGSPDSPRTLHVGNAGTGLYSLSAGALTLHGDLGIGGATTGSGSFNQTGGTLSLSQSLTLGSPSAANAAYSLSTGTLLAPTITNHATFTAPSGILGTPSTTFTNHGSFTAGANLTFAGHLVNHATVSLPATFSTGGYTSHAPLTLPANRRIDSNTLPFTNESSLTLTGGTLAGTGGFTNNNFAQGHATFAGTGPFTNNAAFSVAGGPLVIATTSLSFNYANLDLSTGNPLRLTGGPFNNLGTVALNSSSITGTAPFVNAGGTLVGPGTVSAPFSNVGTLLAPTGTLNFPAGLSNAATLRLLGPGASLVGGTLLNTGTLTGDGTVTNPVTNEGRIEPAGYLTLYGPVTNAPIGTLAIPAGSTLSLIAPFSSETNQGLISLAGGTLLHVNRNLTNTGHIAGHGTLHTASLTNAGTLTLTGGTTTLIGPLTNTPAGTLQLRFTPTLFTHPVTNDGTLTITTANVTFAQGLTTTPTPVPLSSFNLPPSSFSSLTLCSDASLHASYLHQSSLTSAGAITLRPRQQGGQPSTIATLTLLPTSTFDLADNPLTLTNTPAATIRQYLADHRLTSTTPDPDNTHSLAYLFSGGPQDQALVQLTLTGDANLDGLLNADDYALLDKGFVTSGQFWSDGDFNYDGQVTPADYLLIDRTYLLTKAQGWQSLGSSFLSMRESQFGPTYVTQLLTSIPEPSSLLLSTLCLLLSSPLLPRRRPTRKLPPS